MNKKIKKVELVLRKINYLFDSIDANPLQSSNLEMALLKRYAIDLYDTILEFEEADAWEIRNTHRLLEDINTSPELSATVSNEIEALEAQAKEENTAPEEEVPEAVSKEIEIENLQTRLEETVTEDLSSVMKDINMPVKEEEIDKQDLEKEIVESEEEEKIGKQDLEKETVKPEEDKIVLDEVPEFILEKETPSYIEEDVLDPNEIPGIKSVSSPLEDMNKTTVLTGLAGSLFGKEESDTKSTISIDELSAEDTSIYQPEPEEIINAVEPEPDIIDEVLADRSSFLNETEESVTTPITNIFSNPDPTPEPEVEVEVEEILEPVAEIEEPIQEPLETVLSFTKEEESRPAKVIDRLRYSNSEETSNKKFNINYNQRFGFINELFDGKEDVYVKTINDLEGCSNVIEAFTYLNLNVKLKYNWQDDNPLAKDFQQIIKNRFLGE